MHKNCNFMTLFGYKNPYLFVLKTPFFYIKQQYFDYNIAIMEWLGSPRCEMIYIDISP